jgi:hypothetical protein
MNPDLEANGAGVEVDEVGPAVAAITRLLDDPDRRAAMADGLERFRERFFASGRPGSAERVAQLLADVAQAQ